MIEEFWPWFRNRSRRKVGYRLLLNRWLVCDAIIAAILTYGLLIDGFGFAAKALFPAASILVGMAFAWTSRASTILNSEDFRSRLITEKNPLEDYIYGFQLSILILITCVIYLAIMSAGGFNFYIYSREASRTMSSFFMYSLICLTIRECWSIINFTSLLTLLDDNAK